MQGPHDVVLVLARQVLLDFKLVLILIIVACDQKQKGVIFQRSLVCSVSECLTYGVKRAAYEYVIEHK